MPNPTLSLPSDGDYKALPRHLMYQIISMPNKLAGTGESMASAWEFSGPPDYDEFFEYRREHLSKLGLKALDLIDALCSDYIIPLPERPEFYAPKESFKSILMKSSVTYKSAANEPAKWRKRSNNNSVQVCEMG